MATANASTELLDAANLQVARLMGWKEYSDRLFDEDRDQFFVPRSWECRLACLLYDLGYGLSAARSVIDQANELGSLECSVLVRDEDRAKLEAVLPDASEATWSRFDGLGPWGLTEAALALDPIAR